MKRYKIIIILENGDRVEAKSVGEDQIDALDRLIATEQYKNFVGDNKVLSYDVTFLENADTVNPDNYAMQTSATRPGWWVVTDRKNNVVVQFEQGRFNETAKVTPLYDFPKEPIGVATILREIGEYVALYHAELA